MACSPARADEVAGSLPVATPVCIVSSGAIALGAATARASSAGRRRAPTSGRFGRWPGTSPAGLGAAFRRSACRRRRSCSHPQTLQTGRGTSTSQHLDALFRLEAVPVVNENDATATDEITFGDNDALAAQVAFSTHARLLVLLTEVDGVYSRAPGTPGAELLDDGRSVAIRLGPERGSAAAAWGARSRLRSSPPAPGSRR